MNTKVILILIILLGLFLRVVNINNNPLSLYGDELTIALDSYSLYKTGHDQLGNLLPLTFPMGAGRPALYVYASIPFVAIFGPTALGVRLLSVLSGVGIVFLLYILGKRFFGEKVGLAAALLVSVTPWAISLSRAAFEANLALFLATLGVYLFLRASEKGFLYIPSAMCFGLTLHTYPTYKVSLLFFLPLLFWFSFKREYVRGIKVYFLVAAITLGLFAALAATQTLAGKSETRFLNINVFSQQDLKSKIEQKINFERSITDLPGQFIKYFHNKGAEYTKVILENYLQNFSLDFLLIHGDRNPRHNMATMGQLFLAQVILILVGLVSFWNKEKQTLIFLICWLLIAPIATSVIDTPHGLRSAFMLPPLIFFVALGLITVINFKNRILISSVILIFFIQFIFFIQKLYFLAPNEYSNFWSYPAKLASEITLGEKNKYDYIILSNKIDSIEYAYPAYAKIEPGLIIDQNRSKTNLDGFAFKKFGNVYIGNISLQELESFKKNLKGSLLYIGSSLEDTKSIQNIEQVNTLNKNSALVVKKY